MSRTVDLSDELYSRLELAVKKSGSPSIQELLATTFPASDDELAHRRAWFERISAFQQSLNQKYGVQPDSVAMIREDRER